MAQENLDVNQINARDQDLSLSTCHMENCDWYKDVIYYLQHMQSPPHLIENEKRTIKLHLVRYIIVNGVLWWRNFEGILLKCIDQQNSEKILKEMHSSVYGGHYMAKTTTHKVMRVGFWWPSIFKETQVLVRKCDSCQSYQGFQMLSCRGCCHRFCAKCSSE